MLATVIVDQANPPGTFPTISAGVAAANPGDTVVVHKGIYHESVVVDKKLNIRGARFGKDARNHTLFSATTDSILDGSGLATPGFLVQASDVRIDGFVVENFQGAGAAPFGTGSGIFLSPLFSGYQVRNNVVINNSIGVYFGSKGNHKSELHGNLFLSNNNDGGASAAAGNAIYSDQGLVNAEVESNKFVNNLNSGFTIGLPTPPVVNTNIEVERNESVNDLNGFTNWSGVKNSEISNNKITVSGGAVATGSAIFFGGANNNILVTTNKISGAGLNSGTAGVRINNIFGPGFGNNALNILSNNIDHRTYGIRSTDTNPGAAMIIKNKVRAAEIAGIIFEAGTIGNVIRKNDVSGSGVFDYEDDTTGGTGTGITDNFYNNNKGFSENTPDLATPTGHDPDFT